jgi:hypothetical protein
LNASIGQALSLVEGLTGGHISDVSGIMHLGVASKQAGLGLQVGDIDAEGEEEAVGEEDGTTS